EHVGLPRTFARWQRFFAASVGDLVALALETERRVVAERERTKLATRLGQARHLEGLGYLAAGVAHDLRNLLLIVTGNVEVLARTASEAARPAADDILEAVRRSKELCDLLLAYAGHSRIATTRVALGTLVVETGRLLRTRTPENVGVETVIEPGLPEITGDATAVRQVVMNLIINAFDALADRGGRIVVRVRREEPRAELAFDFRQGVTPSLLLEVTDEGPGMSAETQARIFDPFFTTKRDGHGFGLASVLAIVRSHAGALEVESEPGRGTTLRVWLPIATAVA
ncbi:MAG TPA: ATP-binding protein, partial [Polyangiaceae bacterium]